MSVCAYIGAGWDLEFVNLQVFQDVSCFICMDALPDTPHYLFGQYGYPFQVNFIEFLKHFANSLGFQIKSCQTNKLTFIDSKNRILLLILLISPVLLSCEKDLNILDFKDEFGNYQPELKIEGLLQQDKPEDSIIRIIRTSRVSDKDIYNGIDDD
ncbi:hypothetical protein COB52_04345, partial [Candidatus Kaiserbacteria bacterium]